ncbi:hypothetical protein FACS1894130_01680 [Spirochaetia bacterium]|nr:hypothetical protein FACS1894130_01680 [Spirochaetia bacterium]
MITGYYYDSKIVKFIDTIKDNHIISSIYYDSENNEIYQSNYSYNDGKISTFNARCRNNDFVFLSEIKFKYFNDFIEASANRVIENTNVKINFFSSGYYSSFGKPIYFDNFDIGIGEGTLFSDKTTEKYIYSKDNLISRKIYEENNIVCNIEFKYTDNNLIETNEKRFDKDGVIYYEKIIENNNDISEEKVILDSNNEFSTRKYKTETIDNNLSIVYYYTDDKIEDGVLKCQDETVSININDGKIEPKNKYITLNFKLDPFLDFLFIHNNFYNLEVWRPE